MQDIELPNVTCASCELARDCDYARRIRDEWLRDRAREDLRLETGCVLAREEIEDLLRNYLACPVAYLAFLVELEARFPTFWDRIDAVRLQQWISRYIRIWEADKKLRHSQSKLRLTLGASLGKLEDTFRRVGEDLPGLRVKIALYRYLVKMDDLILREDEIKTLLKEYPVAAGIWEDVGSRISEGKVEILWDHVRRGGDSRLIAGSIGIEEYYAFLRGCKADSPEMREKVRQFVEVIDGYGGYNAFLNREELEEILDENPVIYPALRDLGLL